jgi:hypothetical protein
LFDDCTRRGEEERRIVQGKVKHLMMRIVQGKLNLVKMGGEMGAQS